MEYHAGYEFTWKICLEHSGMTVMLKLSDHVLIFNLTQYEERL
jgi:hypothetical protein